MTTSKSPAAAAIRSSIRRALRSDDQQPAPITDLQAAVNDALAALDRTGTHCHEPRSRTQVSPVHSSSRNTSGRSMVRVVM